MQDRLELGLPFTLSTTCAGESRYRSVHGYDSVRLVAKTDKIPYHAYNSIDGAITAIENCKTDREFILQLGRKYGIFNEQVPPSEFIIHRHPLGHVTFSEVQYWYKDGETLYKLGTRVMDMPEQTLRELKNFFKMNIAIWKKNGLSIDLVGSSNTQFSSYAKFARRVFPLFFSENIVIDATSTVRLVDHGLHSLDGEEGRFIDRLRIKSEVVGSYISSTVLSLVIASRKLAYLVPKWQS